MNRRKLKFPDYMIHLGETVKAAKYVKFEEECYVWISKSVITHGFISYKVYTFLVTARRRYNRVTDMNPTIGGYTSNSLFASQ